MDEIINYVMTNPENTNPNVLRGMLENSGGGGDFTTAELTITAPRSMPGAFLVASFFDDSATMGRMPTKSGKRDVILYEGNAGLLIEDDGSGYTYEVTGNISGSASDGFTITGDCAITITENLAI